MVANNLRFNSVICSSVTSIVGHAIFLCKQIILESCDYRQRNCFIEVPDKLNFDKYVLLTSSSHSLQPPHKVPRSTPTQLSSQSIKKSSAEQYQPCLARMLSLLWAKPLHLRPSLRALQYHAIRQRPHYSLQFLPRFGMLYTTLSSMYQAAYGCVSGIAAPSSKTRSWVRI